MNKLGRKAVVPLVGLLTCAWVQSAVAQPQAGDFFITESGPGEVTNIKAGGDMAAEPAFATGIPTPMGLCRGPNDDMYVTSQNPSAPGAVYVITDGGDFSSASTFADVPGFPTSLSCTPTEILVATLAPGTYVGEIYDITGGGDFTSASPLAEGFGSQLWTIFEDEMSTLWGVTEAGTVFNATAGGDVSGNAFATNIPGAAGGRGLAWFTPHVYVGAVGNGSVYEFTSGGDLSSATSFASGVGTVRGLFSSEGFGFYAADQSMVYDISAGGDVSANTFAFGLGDMFNAQMLYWHGCGDSIVWAAGGEQCDDGNTTAGDGCSETCTTEGAGGGGPGGGGGTGGTGGAGGTGGTGATGGTGGSTSTPPPSGEEDDGCGCRVGVGARGALDGMPVGATLLLLLSFAGLARRRRQH